MKCAVQSPSDSVSEERPQAKKAPPTKGRENMKATLLAGLEYLYHHPQMCSHNRLRHFIRNMQVFALSAMSVSHAGMHCLVQQLYIGHLDRGH